MVTTENDKPAAPAPVKKRGGARAGAGRPVKNPVVIEPDAEALAFLKACYLSGQVPMPLRIRAAGIVVAATVARPAQPEKLGKKEKRQAVAEELFKAGGRFSPRAPPLHVVPRTKQDEQ